MSEPTLVLGPMLRHVDATCASVWVETAAPARVTVVSEGRRWEAATFTVHGHHYALVEVEGLAPGSVQTYTVEVDGREVWPLPDSEFPPSRIATLPEGDFPLVMAFGSCRTSVPHDAEGNRTNGVDALRTYAFALADADIETWPHLIAFLGDQVYADETSEEMREFIASRRSLDEPPYEELQDYEEYAHLYQVAWQEPAGRWLYSTVPSTMIFDDHDVRDDWNTSEAWRIEINKTDWWHDRIVAGLASYWVYQHLGNLTPDERNQDEIWQAAVRASQTPGADIGDLLDDFAARVDEDPEAYRWSFVRDLGGNRLIVVDSRAARVLQEGRRSMLDDNEMAWLDDQMVGGFEHLFFATSLPFLMHPGLHALERWNERMCEGAWGSWAAKKSEELRQFVDLEHWAAFHDGFDQVAAMVEDVAEGRRGEPPASIMFLSGDVHHSYVSEIVGLQSRTRVLQAVCSPIRNPLPRVIRWGTYASSKAFARPVAKALLRSVRADDPRFAWHTVKGPWYDNNIAQLSADGPRMTVDWFAGEVGPSGEGIPTIRRVSRFRL